ncbi:ATP-binding protein [Streptomyces litchfieldiae]|uniref:ATP-binding protein n=1 Tax=Streptomyces litchfieldiae TaxID=3075543 RepID=A0ABU2MZ80_9ACTN|nr:ATP-binding protein [Streptomyces sp. DSM 44938]MDT0346677.1 ATP-binding protein [Streptomyces sp. DSM 44938]
MRVEPAATRVRSVSLLADHPGTPSAARRTARLALQEWELSRLADDVELCVSELVGNTVQHAKGVRGERTVVLSLRCSPSWLIVEVSDEDPTPPTLPAAQLPLSDSGRGLFIVRALTDATWWAPREPRGKSVLCRFDFDRP